MNDTSSVPTPRESRIPQLVSGAEHAFLLEGYRHLLTVPPGTETRLAGALRDTLEHPGSLARAQLAFGLLAGAGADAFGARELAVALEYFHTASLLFDDLPSMDDARERRGQPCPHVVYGEASAILAALAFVNQGYALLWRVLARLPARRRLAATELVRVCLGAEGILGGQARDLAFAAGPAGAAEVLQVAQGKTVTLIRLTLLLPALVAGLRAPARRQLDRLAEAWGLAYQMLDDFKDCFGAAEETGKTTGRDATLGRPNLVAAQGPAQALAELRHQLAEGRAALVQLNDAPWPALHRLQALLEREGARVSERLAKSA